MNYDRLTDWTVCFTPMANNTIAVTKHREKKIVVNTNYLSEMLRRKLLDEIVGHELAHALLPPEAEHKYIWKRMAILLTGRAKKTYREERA